MATRVYLGYPHRPIRTFIEEGSSSRAELQGPSSTLTYVGEIGLDVIIESANSPDGTIIVDGAAQVVQYDQDSGNYVWKNA